MSNKKGPPYYQAMLIHKFAEKQKKNPKFSLRSYASLLGLQAPTLSHILNGKRELPVAHSLRICQKLGLTPNEREYFQASLIGQIKTPSRAKKKAVAKKIIQPDQGQNSHSIIAEWEHFGILTLLECELKTGDVNEIAKRLKLSVACVKSALIRLEQANLVVQDIHGKWSPTQERLTTTEDISSVAIRQSHHTELALAQQVLEEVPVDERDFSAVLIAGNPKNLAKAKQEIRKFRQRMIEIMEEGEKTEVYRINIQLYPKTVLQTGEK